MRKTALMIGTMLFILALTALPGCQSAAVRRTPALGDEGQVLVYLEPLAQEADRLRFSLDGISAIREDGAEVPLTLSMKKFSRPAAMRQRLVAVGRLPEGTYSGLLFKVNSASLDREEGKAALLVPEEPVRRDFPFKVERKKALVLTLTLDYAASLTQGMRFTPAWTVAIPARPIIGLIGYVSDYAFNAVMVFDKARHRVTGALATGSGPWGMALDRTGNRLYVALSGDDAVEVVNVVDGTVLTRIGLAQGDAPTEIALSADGRTLMIVNSGSDSLGFIDTTALVETDRIAVGKRPRTLLLDRTGRRAYVFNTLSNNISVVDVAYRSVVGSIPTGPEPVRGRFNSAGDRLYVAHAAYPYLFVIDPASFSVLQREFMGAGVLSLEIDTRTDLLYIGKRNDTEVGVYDPLTLNAAEYIPAGGAVDYMAIDGESNDIYFVVAEKKKVMAVNLVDTGKTSTLDVAGQPARVTMMGER